jgi:hypothetical protein
MTILSVTIQPRCSILGFIPDGPDGKLLLTQADDIVRLTPISGGFTASRRSEPASLALLNTGTSLMALGMLRRRRKPA